MEVDLTSPTINFELGPKLSFEDVQGTVLVQAAAEATASASGGVNSTGAHAGADAEAGGSLAVNIDVSGHVVVGGAGGFDASISMEIDPSEEKATVGLVHEGGWSPLPAGNPVAHVFHTPKFDGTLTIGGEKAYSLEAAAEWDKPLDLLGVVTVGHSTGGARGPALDITLAQDHAAGGSSASPPLEWGVEFVGRATIPAAAGAPALHVHGKLSHSGETSLELGTEEDWQPLQEMMPDFAMPALHGKLDFGAAAQSHTRRLGSGVSASASGMSLALESPEVGHCSIGDGMVDFYDLKGRFEYAYPDAAVAVSAEGRVRLGGEDGFEASAVVELASGGGQLELGKAGEKTHSSAGLSHSTATRQHHLDDARAKLHEEEALSHKKDHAALQASSEKSARVVVKHTGGWKPFPCLVPEYETPAIDGELLLNKPGKYISFEAAVATSAPINLMDAIHLGPSTSRGKGGAGPTVRARRGPNALRRPPRARASPSPRPDRASFPRASRAYQFGVSVEQPVKGGESTFGSFFEANACVTIGTETCLDVRAELQCALGGGGSHGQTLSHEAHLTEHQRHARQYRQLVHSKQRQLNRTHSARGMSAKCNDAAHHQTFSRRSKAMSLEDVRARALRKSDDAGCDFTLDGEYSARRASSPHAVPTHHPTAANPHPKTPTLR